MGVSYNGYYRALLPYRSEFDSLCPYVNQRKDETKEQFNARANEYMKARYHSVRAFHVARLGGKCIDCGATQGLEFDHRDQADKKYNVSHIMLHNVAKVTKEIDKCDLRCIGCHMHMTAYQKLQGVNILMGLSSSG